jgi:hypothetical protein
MLVHEDKQLRDLVINHDGELEAMLYGTGISVGTFFLLAKRGHKAQYILPLMQQNRPSVV